MADADHPHSEDLTSPNALRGILPQDPLGRIFSIVLLLYIIGISAFNRSFAGLHISVGEIPIFVGEATIALLVSLWIVSDWHARRRRMVLDPLGISLLIYALVGFGFAVKGLIAGYGLAAIRDFALVYYLVFFFLAATFTERGGRPIWLMRSIVLGASIGSVASVVQFASDPLLNYEHGASGALALLSWIAVIYVVVFRHEAASIWARVAYLMVLVLGMVTIFLAAYRTLMAAMVASIALLWGLGFSSTGRRVPTIRSSALILTVVMLVSTVLISISATTMAAAGDPGVPSQRVTLLQGVGTLSTRWVRGIIFGVRSEPGADSGALGDTPEPETAPGRQATGQNGAISVSEASLAFRLAAWRNALHRISGNPLTGIGFGPAPALYSDEHCLIPYSPTSNCGNAHNTYLTLAMRMGIPILIFFLAFNGYLLIRFSSALLQTHEPHEALLGILALVAYVSFGLYAFMSLFFESPYLSSLYWILIAVMHSFQTRPPALRIATSRVPSGDEAHSGDVVPK
jgi:hypothetical protein